MVRESRHLWVGNLPDSMRDDEIADYFSRFGRVEKVKILPKKSPDGGLAAFVDFVDIRSATKANETTNYIGDRELRTNYNEPGNHPAVLGEGRGRGRPHMYDRGHGGFSRRDRIAPPFNDEGPRRGRYPYGDSRPEFPIKRQRPRRDSEGSRDSERPSSPKYSRTRSASLSSQSERGRSSSPDDRSYSASDSEGRGKSSSPARSNGSGQSQKNTSIQIKNLSTRPGDSSIKDALFHEFKKVGEIVNIKILGTEKDRYALVKFRRSEDAEKSLQSNNKTFLGNEMKISIFKGENKDKEGEANFNMYRKKYRSKDFGSDEVGFDPMATRTLFVGNLDKLITHGDLRKIFEKFGEVVDVDIKKQNPGITTYAFLQFVDINGAMRAKHRMDREFIGRNRIKVGYGRGTPTNVIWLGNVARDATEGQIQRQFHPFGFVKRVIIDRQCWQGLLSFDSVDAATAAFENMRGRFVLGRKILVDFASRSCKEGFYERMERTSQLDRRTLEPSPPPARPAGAMHQGFQASYGRGRGPRGGFGKGYGYAGRYGSERGDFNEYSQGPPDFYPQENYFVDDDYDDYEKELRDYGHRQRERERERESGRRPERDSSRHRERGEYYGREKTRDRKRAYTPLSDEDQPRVFEGKSDEDDNDYSGKDIQSKIVLPNAGEKGQDSMDEVSPEKDQDKKPERKEKRKKKEKKDKSNKRKTEKETLDVNLEKDGYIENETGNDGLKEEKRDEEKLMKPEKKKKRKSSEKGLAAEEKARKKELKKLKKLKKLQAELGRSEELSKSVIEEREVNDGFPLKKEGLVDAGEKVTGDIAKNERVSTTVSGEKVPNVNEEEVKHSDGDKSLRTPPTPGLEEDERGIENVSASSMKIDDKKGKEEAEGSDSEIEKVRELERKRDELRRLEEEEGIKGNKITEPVIENFENEETANKVNNIAEFGDEKFTDVEVSLNRKPEDSDSDISDLVIDEMATKEDGQDDVKDIGISRKEELASKKEDISHDMEKQDKRETGKIIEDMEVDKKEAEELISRPEIEAHEEVHRQEETGVNIELKEDSEVLVKREDGEDDKQKTEKDDDNESMVDVKKKTERENEVGEGGLQQDRVEEVKKEAKKEFDSDEESDLSKNAETKDIYSSQSDSSGDLEDLDDDEDEVEDRAKDERGLTRKHSDSGAIPLKEELQGPSSPCKTPPTPDLEEDTLRMQGKFPGYGSYPKAFGGNEKEGSLYNESDEEKKELEKSMKEANYQKRMTGDDKKHHRKDKAGKQVSSPSDHDQELASGRHTKSPIERKRKEQIKLKKEIVKDARVSPVRRTMESEIRGFRGSPKDSPDNRDRKEGRRDRGESPQHREAPIRHRGSLDNMQRMKSPDSRRTSPERGKREGFARRGSHDRSLSPRRIHSAERRPGGPRGRERDAKEVKRRDEDRGFEENREIRDNRFVREPPDFRSERDIMREGRDIRDRGFRDQSREGRDFRDARDMRDIRGNELPFKAGVEERNKDRIGRDRGFIRERDIPGRGRDDLPERGFERGGIRGHVPFREGFRDQERPGRHTPPLPPDQRNRSPLPRYPGSAERRPRSPDSRHEGRRPRTPEHLRPRSPVPRPVERRRGRSPERRPSPPRSHERDAEFHRKEPERANYRDQPDRRDKEKERERREKVKEETPPPPPPPPEPRKEQRLPDPGMHQQSQAQLRSTTTHVDSPSGTPGSMITPNPPVSGGTPTPAHFTPPPPPPPTNADTLLDLLRRYPVMWQGLFALKNDSAAVQMHFLSGNVRLAEASLPRSVLAGEVPPPLRISQRMKLEASQLDGVNKRIKVPNDHCMLLALPCGRDPLDVHAQTRALKTGFITYLQVKQAAGIINIINSATKQPAYVLHIFPPCEFAQAHLARVAPDLLDSAADSGHLMVLITPV